jgi:hypothetical protein
VTPRDNSEYTEMPKACSFHFQNETPAQSYVPAAVQVVVTAHSQIRCGTLDPKPIPQSIS